MYKRDAVLRPLNQKTSQVLAINVKEKASLRPSPGSQASPSKQHNHTPLCKPIVDSCSGSQSPIMPPQPLLSQEKGADTDHKELILESVNQWVTQGT